MRDCLIPDRDGVTPGQRLTMLLWVAWTLSSNRRVLAGPRRTGSNTSQTPKGSSSARNCAWLQRRMPFFCTYRAVSRHFSPLGFPAALRCPPTTFQKGE